MSDIAKEATVEVAEHPIRYSLQNVKTFGNDALNNMSMKEAFNQLKENMKMTMNARQACIDNEYVYRTYKKQAIDSMKSVSTKVITPVRTVTTSAMSSIMDGVNKAYKATLDKYAELLKNNTIHLTKYHNFNYKILEAVSLGSFSYGKGFLDLKDRLINKKTDEIARLDEKIKNSKGFRKATLEAKRDVLKQDVDYLLNNKMEAEVWKDRKSPERYFQTKIIPDIKQAGATVKTESAKVGGKIKAIPGKTMSFLKDIGVKTKAVVMNAVNEISKGAVKVYNKSLDIVTDSTLAISSAITGTSKIVNRKMAVVQAAAKSNKDTLNARVKNVEDTNRLILGINDGTINAEEYMSDATKSLKAEVDAIDKMHNPDAAKYMSMKLEREINKDKKDIIKSFKEDMKQDNINIMGKQAKDNIYKASSAVMEAQSKVLGGLNNILINAGQKALSHKIGTVTTPKAPDAGKEEAMDMTKEDEITLS